MRPRIALTVGDPAGIGPETVFTALARPEVRARASLVVIGPEVLRPADVPRFVLGARPSDVVLGTRSRMELKALHAEQA